MERLSPSEVTEQHLPVFKVFPPRGKHPPVALNRPVCVIGRDYDANLPLDAPMVSRHHALIIRDRWGVYLRDLASTNGVLRNNVLVRETALADDDKVRVGAFILRCDSGFGGHGDEPGAGEVDAAIEGGADVIEQASELQPPVDRATLPPAPAAPAAPAAELRVGDRTIALPAGQRTFLIGRREGCDLQLDSESVGGVHAVVFELEGMRHVRDLSAPGGTSVNGIAIHKTVLHSGDVLRVADVDIEYRELVSAEAIAAAAQGTSPISDDVISLAEDSISAIPIAPEQPAEVEPPLEPEPVEPEFAEPSLEPELIEPQPIAAEPLEAEPVEPERIEVAADVSAAETGEAAPGEHVQPEMYSAIDDLLESLAPPPPSDESRRAAEDVQAEPTLETESEPVDDAVIPTAATAPTSADAAPPGSDARPVDKTDPDQPTSTAEKMTTLVDELAEKASSLKEVWKEHQSQQPESPERDPAGRDRD